MARPIRPTPILFGKDARRFERLMRENRKETPEQRERRLLDYEDCMEMLKAGEELEMKRRGEGNENI